MMYCTRYERIEALFILMVELQQFLIKASAGDFVIVPVTFRRRL